MHEQLLPSCSSRRRWHDAATGRTMMPGFSLHSLTKSGGPLQSCPSTTTWLRSGGDANCLPYGYHCIKSSHLARRTSFDEASALLQGSYSIRTGSQMSSLDLYSKHCAAALEPPCITGTHELLPKLWAQRVMRYPQCDSSLRGQECSLWRGCTLSWAWRHGRCWLAPECWWCTVMSRGGTLSRTWRHDCRRHAPECC